MVSSIGVAESAVDLVQVDGVVGLVAVAKAHRRPGRRRASCWSLNDQASHSKNTLVEPPATCWIKATRA
jgi:hypothetical protein